RRAVTGGEPRRGVAVSRETRPWQRVAEDLGHTLTGDQIELIDLYHQWILTEAVPAGGIGPAEVDRLPDRHLADSLLYARFFAPPKRLWDLGSGIGLPGI